MGRSEIEPLVRPARQMADSPEVVHPISGRCDLRVIICPGYFDGLSIAHFEHVIADLGMSVALRLRESIVIDLGLRMMMGRIAGPTARAVDHFPYDQLRGRTALVIEKRPDKTPARVLSQARPTIFGDRVLWKQPSDAVKAAVPGLEYGPFGVFGLRGHGQ